MAKRVHFTLTASTMASATLTAEADIETDNTDVAIYQVETHRINRPIRSVTVINHGDTAVFYRLDEVAPTDSGGDDDFVVPANGGGWRHEVNADSITVLLISTGTPLVSVIGE